MKKIAAIAATFAVAVAAPGAAAGAGVPSTSANWAGYVVAARATTFTSVTATWKQPVVNCTAPERGAAVAFWVGLGGANEDSPGVEQVGTSSHCTAGGATYGGWYQVGSAPAVDLKLAVRPNDVMTASVNALDDGTAILVQLKNRTLGTVATSEVPVTSPPDLSSADWIVEAPMRCAGALCLPVPLQQFTPASFSRIAALGNGSGGTLTRSDWSLSSVQLVPSTVLVAPSTAIAAAAAGAIPVGPAPGGASFQVYWLADGKRGDAR